MDFQKKMEKLKCDENGRILRNWQELKKVGYKSALRVRGQKFKKSNTVGTWGTLIHILNEP